MMTANFEKIEKEKVEGLKFPETEVLTDNDLIQKRKSDLDKALSLGNLDQIKIKIYFEDSETYRFVETTVWGVTDKRVILKQGIVIPINRIHYLEL